MGGGWQSGVDRLESVPALVQAGDMFSMPELLLMVVLAVETAAPRQVDLIDFWEMKCTEGDSVACERAAASRPGVERLDQLDDSAAKFAAQVNRAELEDGRRPRLDLAYRQVIQEYLIQNPALTAAGDARNAEMISYCAEHYHNYWVYRKLWWPTDDAKRPDWRQIYVFIIDHYHGVCLRRLF